MKRSIPVLFALMLIGGFTGCDKKPADQLVDQGSGNPTGTFGSTFAVYSDALLTGGGLFFYPESANQQIALDCGDNPAVGKQSIRYYWSGGDVSGQHGYAGYSLSVSLSDSDFASTPARDYSPAGYTTIHFKARGSVDPNVTVKFEGPDDGDTSTTPPKIEVASLPANWTDYTITFSAGVTSNVKEFFKATFVFTQPAGTTNNPGECVLYVDDIYYE